MNDSRGSRCSTVVLSVLLLLVAAPSLAEGPVRSGSAAKDRVSVEQYWTGEAPIEVKKQAPKSPCVADSAAWKKLWQAFRRNERKVPDIDFEKWLVLVVVSDDPNALSLRVERDMQGDVSIVSTSTEKTYSDPKICKYEFARIKRDGIKSINGKPIAASDSPESDGANEK